MAQLNDLNVLGDSTFQGSLNNKKIDTDSNTMIIEVCRRLDVSTVGNKIEIEIPSGYIGMPIYGSSSASLGFKTYGSDASSWGTNAEVTTTTTRADTDASLSVTTTIGNYTYSGLNAGVPFVKDSIEIEVTTACTGATNPYVCIFGQIICHKE